MIRYENTFWDYCRKGFVYLATITTFALTTLLPSSNILPLTKEEQLIAQNPPITITEPSLSKKKEKIIPPENPVIINVSNSNDSDSSFSFTEKALANNISLTISFDPDKDNSTSKSVIKDRNDIELSYDFSNRRLKNEAVFFSKLQANTARNLENRLTTTIDLTDNNQEIDLMNLRQSGIKIIIDDNIDEGYKVEPYKIARIKRDIEINDSNINLEEIIKELNNKNKLDPIVIDINLSKNIQKQDVDKIVSQLSLLKENGYKLITTKDFYYDYLNLPQYVILRLDDYQTPHKKELFEKVIKDISELGVPQTISVIPAVDVKMSNDYQAKKFLENMYKKGLIEIAMHGYNGEYGEFLQDFEEQKDMMLKAFREFDKITSQNISTVVISNSQSNEFTSKAINYLNKNDNRKISIMSSLFPQDEYVFGFDPDGVFHVSRLIDLIQDWAEPYPLLPINKVIELMGSDDTIINIHPFRHETEEKQQYLIDLINKLGENKNIKFVTMKEFYDETTKPLGVYDDIANAAWNYFVENTNEKTGLFYDAAMIENNKISYRHSKPACWDLASMIFGIVSANKLSLISNEEAENRLMKILNFFNTNELYEEKFPNNFYDIETLRAVEKKGSTASDMGRLLLSLKLVKNNYKNLESICDSIVDRWEIPVYDGAIYGIDEKGKHEEINLYLPYFLNGYTAWGYKVTSLNKLIFVSHINEHDSVVYIPINKETNKPIDFVLTPEPNLLTAIEVGYERGYEKITNLLYEAQKNRYLIEGIPTCLSEGSIDKKPWFLYPGITNAAGDNWPVASHVSGLSEDYADLRPFSSKAAIVWSVLMDDYYADMLRRIAVNNNMKSEFGFTNGIYESDWTENRVMEVNTNAIILESIAYKITGKPLLEK